MTCAICSKKEESILERRVKDIDEREVVSFLVLFVGVDVIELFKVEVVVVAAVVVVMVFLGVSKGDEDGRWLLLSVFFWNLNGVEMELEDLKGEDE